MDTTPAISTLTSTLIVVRAYVRDLNPATLTEEHIALLHQIASFACANAQEARILEDVALAQADEAAALAADRLMAESDALDAQIAHLV